MLLVNIFIFFLVLFLTRLLWVRRIIRIKGESLVNKFNYDSLPSDLRTYLFWSVAGMNEGEKPLSNFVGEALLEYNLSEIRDHKYYLNMTAYKYVVENMHLFRKELVDD